MLPLLPPELAVARTDSMHPLSGPPPPREERLGDAIGRAIAPVFAATSRLRRARTFHPSGDCLEAEVDLVNELAAGHREIAERLVGGAFVRFSDALTKKKARWPDVLGCAIRWNQGPASSSPWNRPQDLLFATIKHPWTMPFAPLTTKVTDWLANDYFAVSPFTVRGLRRGEPARRVWWRLRPERPSNPARAARPRAVERTNALAHAVTRGEALLTLGIAQSASGPFQTLARLRLVRLLPNDPDHLRFDPFLVGRGIEPRGFVHALRRGVYEASQLARLAHPPNA